MHFTTLSFAISGQFWGPADRIEPVGVTCLGTLVSYLSVKLRLASAMPCSEQ